MRSATLISTTEAMCAPARASYASGRSIVWTTTDRTPKPAFVRLNHVAGGPGGST